ncbi:MAG TPA: hypothetical protein VF789_30545 [Thermoanaerobaculia bacterium]
MLSSELSLSEMLTNLEAQIDLLRERETRHAERAAYHEEQRSQAAAELAVVLQSYEALKSAATRAAELAVRLPPPPSAPSLQEPPPELPPGGTKLRGALVEELMAVLPKGEVFGPTRIADELNRRYGRALSRPADSRFTSSALRRLVAYGWLERVQKGTPHHEALYRKV